MRFTFRGKRNAGLPASDGEWAYPAPVGSPLGTIQIGPIRFSPAPAAGPGSRPAESRVESWLPAVLKPFERLAFSSRKPAPDPKGEGDRSRYRSDAAEGTENDEETGEFAQPSDPSGVREDMATLVLDRPALGTNAASRPGSGAMPGTVPNYGADESSDAAVMLRVAAGDEAGFNYLVEKHYRAMIHFLFRMVHNQAVAEELAQEVFLRVYRSRESYRAEAKFTTWLYRIATNLAVNQARDTRYERSAQTVYLDAPDPETGTTPDVADDEPIAEQQLLRDERMAAIRKHVMDLPERQRMAVLMHKYQGMDYKQIGEVLKLSESATKSLLFRAYQTLRDKLKDFV